MIAHVEVFPKQLKTGCLRVYLDGSIAMQSPYVFAATVVWRSREAVELKGVSGSIASLLRVRSAILQQFADMGVRRLMWNRQRGPSARRVVIDVEGWNRRRNSDRVVASGPMAG